MYNLDPKDIAIIKRLQEKQDFVTAGAKVIALTEMGWQRKEVAESLSVSPMTLRNWANAAKATGVHADFSDLTPKSKAMCNLKNFKNHIQVRASRKFTGKQEKLLYTLHSSTKSTRQWREFKGLLTYLTSLRYPVTHIAKALDTSNSHVQTLLTSPESTFIEEFHSLSFQPESTENLLIVTKTDSTALQLTKLRPLNTVLFTSELLESLHPPLETTPLSFPNDGPRAIMENNVPYLINQAEAIRYLGIMNEKKEVL